MDYSKYDGHTEGPWAVAEKMGWEPSRTIHYELAIVDCGDGEMLHIHEAPIGLATDKTGQNEANALLMADAPKLLARCKELEEQIGDLIKVTKGLCYAVQKHDIECAQLGVCNDTDCHSRKLIKELDK